jgi:hypothetical protein
MKNIPLPAHIIGKSSCLSSSHGMRNELHFRLNWLHRLVQSSRFCLKGDQKYLILTEREGQRKTVKSSFTDEIKLVAHPVGSSVTNREELERLLLQTRILLKKCRVLKEAEPL